MWSLLIHLWYWFKYKAIIGEEDTCSHTLSNAAPKSSVTHTWLLAACWRSLREFLGGRKLESVCVHKLSSHEAHYASHFASSTKTPLAATHSLHTPKPTETPEDIGLKDSSDEDSWTAGDWDHLGFWQGGLQVSGLNFLTSLGNIALSSPFFHISWGVMFR